VAVDFMHAYDAWRDGVSAHRTWGVAAR
jgi:hypothetical protein